jgi:hypothetical protein
VSIKYTNIFHCKTLQNFPKFGFLVWKQTIWQPCSTWQMMRAPSKNWINWTQFSRRESGSWTALKCKLARSLSFLFSYKKRCSLASAPASAPLLLAFDLQQWNDTIVNKIKKMEGIFLLKFHTTHSQARFDLTTRT